MKSKRSDRRSMRAIVALVLISVGCYGGVANGQASAAPVAGLQITAQPSLFPAFDPEINDYVTRCEASTPVQLSVTAPAETLVSVDQRQALPGTFSTSVGLTEGQSFDIDVRGPDDEVTRYFVRCLPADFPEFSAERSGPTQSEWYVVAPFIKVDFGAPPTGTSDKYVAIFDNNGVPVWWFESDSVALDAKVLSNGNIIWLDSLLEGTHEYRLDGTFVRSVNTVGSGVDVHEVLLLPNGNYLLPRYFNTSGVDLTSCGGSASGTIVDNDLQEITPTGELVWQWNARDHIPVSELSPRWADQCGQNPADIYHFNSAELDGDGYVISLRHMDAVYRIDRATGAVDWKLGGRTRPESLTVLEDTETTRAGIFGGQHDARILPDGTLTVSDNGTRRGREPRAVRYALDLNARTATLVEDVRDPDHPNSICCGSARKLPGGNWVTSFGNIAFVSELTPSGTRVFRLAFPQALFTYRAHPIPHGILSPETLRSGMDAMAPRPRNSRPTATRQSVSVEEDGSEVIALSGTDPDGDPIAFSVSALPQGGRLFEGDSTASADEITTVPRTLSGTQVTYVPEADRNGSDAFRFTTNDGAVDSLGGGIVTLTVTEANDAPTAVDDALAPIVESSGARLIPFSQVLANDKTGPANESQQSLTVASLSDVEGGTAQVTATGISFTPTPDYFGPAGFRYVVRDNGTTSSVADAREATARAAFTITPARRTLTVARTGDGVGAVSGPGINCGTDCAEIFDHGTTVTLQAQAAENSTFSGWSSDVCPPTTATSSCTLTLERARSVTATFAKSAEGSGAVFLPFPTDNCPGVDNDDQADWDDDGIGDACDGDVDGDGAANGVDNCDKLSNESQADVDGDGIGDACDERDDRPVDTDGDGVANPSDNCPDRANAGQEDGDRDGIGDACDEPASVRVTSEVTASYNDGVFSGVVSVTSAARIPAAPSVPQCVSGRTVKIKQGVAGKDVVVSKAVTNGSGAWSSAPGGRLKGRFYAQVGRASTTRQGTTTVCARARSGVIRI